MSKIKVLFICIHNSARSQMAEELLRKLGEEYFEVESAGLEPGKINPLVVEVLKEEDIDISSKQTQSVDDLYKAKRRYDYVITVCDEMSAQRCPVFPSLRQKFHWPFPDPSSFEGSLEERLEKIRLVKDEIKSKITEWIKTFN